MIQKAHGKCLGQSSVLGLLLNKALLLNIVLNIRRTYADVHAPFLIRNNEIARTYTTALADVEGDEKVFG